MTPDTTLDAFRRAHAFFDAGQPAEAVRLLDEVVAASPDSTAALELRARALFASAQLGRAEQAFRQLVERAPDDAWSRTALARTLERQGRDREAAGQWRIAQALTG
ncbi:MAG: tetratricopeptide repeat protein [Actinomycetota bacterium]|nr:tetratricopeptide repeat protein [Actinomycetota bacterium]